MTPEDLVTWSAVILASAVFVAFAVSVVVLFAKWLKDL